MNLSFILKSARTALASLAAVALTLGSSSSSITAADAFVDRTTANHLDRRQIASTMAAAGANLPQMWFPPTQYQVMAPPAVPDNSPAYPESVLQSAAMNAISQMMNVPQTNLVMMNSVMNQHAGMCHTYFMQTVNGLPVVNAPGTVTTDMQGNMMAVGASFAPMSMIQQAQQPQNIVQQLENIFLPNQQQQQPAPPGQAKKATTSAAQAVPTGNAAAAAKRGQQKDRRATANMITAAQAVVFYANSMGLNTPTLSMSLTSAAGSTTGPSTDPNAVTVNGAPFAIGGIDATLAYYQTATGLVKCWDLSIHSTTVWHNAFIDVMTGNVLGVNNWNSALFHNLEKQGAAEHDHNADHVHELERRQVVGVALPPATYQVVPIAFQSLTQLPGMQTQQVTNPFDPFASPIGWQGQVDPNTGAINFVDTTFGNNVFATNNSANLPNPLTNTPVFPLTKFNFNYPIDLATPPTNDVNNVQAGVTNMFYVSNVMHDIFYRYGFDEPSGNFQLSNFKNGGVANDPVVATSQDASGFNNANFMTPPDGKAGRMRMFLFNTVTPNRDGALENDIVVHELTHGLSNRLTGGAANANCLVGTQPGGMGEGWSDMVALVMQMQATDTAASNKVVGAWVTNNAKGVRQFPYSTSLTTNPHMFSDVNKNPEVHAVGEVWASMLYEVYWNMMAINLAFTEVTNLGNAATPGTSGNSDFMLTLVNGLKMQPCNPTFTQARDAFIAASQANFQDKYTCAIWNGFAKRGLGTMADSNLLQNDKTLPAGCAQTF